MDEMRQRELDRNDTEHLRRVVHPERAVVHVIGDAEESGSPASEASQTAAASQPPGQSTGLGGEDHEEECVHSHISPVPVARLVSTPPGDQQFTLEQIMSTLALDNPQEANPEGAESPIQQAVVRATHDGEESVGPASGSSATASSQVPERPTGPAGRDSGEERIRFHRAPLPVATLLSMPTGMAATEEQQHFTMEHVLAILTSNAA